MQPLTSGIFTEAVEINLPADLGGGAVGTYLAPIQLPPGCALKGVVFSVTVAGGTETGAINVQDSGGNNLISNGVQGASGNKVVAAAAPPVPQPWPADGEVYIGVTVSDGLIHTTAAIITLEYTISNI